MMGAAAAIGGAIYVVYGMSPSSQPERMAVLAERLHSELEERVTRILVWERTQQHVLQRAANDPRLARGVEDALEGRPIALDALLDRTCLDLVGCALYTLEGQPMGAFNVRDVPPGLLSAAAAGYTTNSHVLPTDSVGHLEPNAEHASFSVFFATPVHLREGGRVVLVGRVRADEALDPLVRSNPLGRTGESYVFEERGYMVTRSRFDHEPARDRPAPRVLGRPAVELLTPAAAPTLAVTSVRRGRTMGIDMDGYVDYRGVVVVGAWRWIDELGAGVVTEMDLAEALNGPSVLQ